MELTSVAWYVVIVSFCVFSAIESIDKHSFLRKVDCEIYITPCTYKVFLITTLPPFSCLFLWYFCISNLRSRSLRFILTVLTFHKQRLCATMRLSNSISLYRMILADLGNHCNLEFLTIYSSSPWQNILLVLWRVESQYTNVMKNFLFFWVPSIFVTTPHCTMIAAGHISYLYS